MLIFGISRSQATCAAFLLTLVDENGTEIIFVLQ